ncbi:MAG: hypothetical protein H6559_29165 [Lewinellaceae bacterium]|nr:hypothetical protein [Lewinellaceae bacterium]
MGRRHFSALLFCKNGTLLHTSEEGLLRFDPATGQSRDFPFGNPQKLVPDSYYISNLYEDSEGIVWIIGFKGLIKAAPADGGYRYEYFKTDPSDPSSLSYNTVLSVVKTPSSPAVTCGCTKSGGLNRASIGKQVNSNITKKRTGFRITWFMEYAPTIPTISG